MTKDVHLAIYDVRGRRIATLASEVMGPGTFRLHWDAKGRVGVYLIQLRLDGVAHSAERVVLFG